MWKKRIFMASFVKLCFPMKQENKGATDLKASALLTSLSAK